MDRRMDRGDVKVARGTGLAVGELAVERAWARPIDRRAAGELTRVRAGEVRKAYRRASEHVGIVGELMGERAVERADF